MTQLAEKATQVVDGIFKSFGGSGSNPDVPQFNPRCARRRSRE